MSAAVSGRGSVGSTGRPWRTRGVVGVLVAAGVLAVLTIGLVQRRGDLSVATALTLYLLATVAITAVAGRWCGLAAAVASPLLANWYLIPPYHTLRIGERDHVVELAVFVSVTVIVSTFVTAAEQRAADAERAQREAAVLAALAEAGAADPWQRIVELLVHTLGFRAAGIFDHSEAVAVVGAAPDDLLAADHRVWPLRSGGTLVTAGLEPDAADLRLLRSFLAQLDTALDRWRLRRIAVEAEAIARADELRTAILRAVSHDLRSPLASIKASVSSLLQSDIEWPPAVRDEFLASIDSETDRLTDIVTNLLDLSRLEAGVLRPVLRPVAIDEVLPAVIHGLGPAVEGRVAVVLPEDLPDVEVDPVLLERVLANLLGNAVAWSPSATPITVRATPQGDRVELAVIDHGPGIPAHQRPVVVQPFHRRGDTASGGIGLGLAIADRMLAAMHGRLELRDTDGGGLTAVVDLPAREQVTT
jgi:two-component system sensor histidine kinase KdpD